MWHRAWLRTLVWTVVAAAVIWVAVALSATPDALEDFVVYRRAAWDVRNGVSVYVTHPGELTYEYFPWLAVALVPLTWLPPRVTAVVWTLLVVAAVVVAAWLSAVLAGLHAWRPRYAVLVLAFLPLVWAEVVQGQVNALLMAAALAGVVALTRGQPRTAGACFIAAALIKPHGLIFLPWLSLCHRRVGVTATTMVMASLVVAGWLLPDATLVDWGRRVWRDSLERATEPPNVSVAMWATRLTHGRLDAVLLVLALLAVLGSVIAWFLWRRPKSSASADAADVALLCIAMPLISPQAWFGQLLFALPATVLITAQWTSLRLRDRAIFAASIALISAGAAVLAVATNQFVIDNVSLAMTFGAVGTIWTMASIRASAISPA